MRNGNIFQILLTESDTESTLPAEIERNAESFRFYHPTFAYKRFGNVELAEIIRANFTRDVIDAYHSLRPLAFRADLGRYCLLYLYGGIYADMSMRLLRPIELSDDKHMMCFRDTPGTGLWTVSNGLIAAPAGRDEFRLAIEMICKNVKERYYGANCLHPTGPGLFGRALAYTDRCEDIDMGSLEFLAANRSPHSIGYVDSIGRVICLRMKSGRFTSLGIAGTNDYPEIWNSRQVYGEVNPYYGPKNLHVIEGRDGATRERNGIRYTNKTRGFFVFGPHQSLKPGRYTAVYSFALGSELQGLKIDVFAGRDEELEVVSEKWLAAADSRHVSIDFALEEEAIYQIRLLSEGDANGLVLGLDVFKQ